MHESKLNAETSGLQRNSSNTDRLNSDTIFPYWRLNLFGTQGYAVAMKPTIKPSNPCFSSGPCAKRPGWSVEALKDAAIGRSHRCAIGKKKLADVIQRSKTILNMPSDYHLGIVPASDTGAFEMALWSMLGERGVDVCAWESFGKGWVTDIQKELKIDDLRLFTADYGHLPELAQVDCDRDVVFTYNGTTSGVCVPHCDWINSQRQGLTFCDATSAVFAMDIAWDKMDVVTWSWQKVLGGEAAHGMLALSPRAVERLETTSPQYPLPKIFRLLKGNALNAGIFSGSTINTPSMLAVEDCLDALKWCESIGGLNSLLERSRQNLAVIEKWVAERDWIDFLAVDPVNRSCTSICLVISADWFQNLTPEEQSKGVKEFVAILSQEEVAYDIGSYRDAPAGIRIWGGATVESDDIEALTPWLDWAYATLHQKMLPVCTPSAPKRHDLEVK
jgi:phosphoserine aminotransferase